VRPADQPPAKVPAGTSSTDSQLNPIAVTGNPCARSGHPAPMCPVIGP
jgi:hypothetical protein